MRADALRNIGGFDKRFFQFYEDNDVCVRLKKAGYSLIVEPRAVAIHAQGRSSPPTFKTRCIKHAQTSYSALYFTRKHYGKRAARKRALSIIINCIGRLLRGDVVAATARMAGIFYYMKIPPSQMIYGISER
jgi:GT2 family glycosyltransferase